MSGSLHDVKNDVWMRAVIVSVILLFVGAAAYGAFAVGVGLLAATHDGALRPRLPLAVQAPPAVTATLAPDED